MSQSVYYGTVADQGAAQQKGSVPGFEKLNAAAAIISKEGGGGVNSDGTLVVTLSGDLLRQVNFKLRPEGLLVS